MMYQFAGNDFLSGKLSLGIQHMNLDEGGNDIYCFFDIDGSYFSGDSTSETVALKADKTLPSGYDAAREASVEDKQKAFDLLNTAIDYFKSLRVKYQENTKLF